MIVFYIRLCWYISDQVQPAPCRGILLDQALDVLQVPEVYHLKDIACIWRRIASFLEIKSGSPRGSQPRPSMHMTSSYESIHGLIHSHSTFPRYLCTYFCTLYCPHYLYPQLIYHYALIIASLHRESTYLTGIYFFFLLADFYKIYMDRSIDILGHFSLLKMLIVTS